MLALRQLLDVFKLLDHVRVVQETTAEVETALLGKLASLVREIPIIDSILKGTSFPRGSCLSSNRFVSNLSLIRTMMCRVRRRVQCARLPPRRLGRVRQLLHLHYEAYRLRHGQSLGHAEEYEAEATVLRSVHGRCVIS